jgi:hypothetical protein
MLKYLYLLQSLELSIREAMLCPWDKFIVNNESLNIKEFFIAVRTRNKDAMQACLKRDKLLVYFFFFGVKKDFRYQQDNVGKTCLHWAAMRKDENDGILEEIFRCRPYVNAKDIFGKSALYYAIKGNNVKIIRKIFCAGVVDHEDFGKQIRAVCKETGNRLVMEIVYNIRLLNSMLIFCCKVKDWFRAWKDNAIEWTDPHKILDLKKIYGQRGFNARIRKWFNLDYM